MKQSKWLFVLIIFGVMLISCNNARTDGCPAPPAGFAASALVGTWAAVGSLGNNAIRINEDGTYKQVLYIPETGFDYESGWMPWRIESKDNGLSYLHLEGLLMCAYWRDMKCGDKEVGEDFWYDFCTRQWITTPREGVMLIMGVNVRFKQPLRGIQLVPFTKSPDGTTGPTFELQELKCAPKLGQMKK